MKSLLTLIVFFVSISSFSQNDEKLICDEINKTCIGYVPEPVPSCFGIGWGPGVGIMESSYLYYNDNGVVKEGCPRNEAADKNQALKIVFTADVFDQKTSFKMKADFYYKDGKAFYAKVATEKFNRRHKKIDEKKYEFAFNGELPDDLDADTKDLLYHRIEELL